MAFSANNQRRRDQQAAKWAALPPEERQRIEAENVEFAKILAESGRKALAKDDLRNEMMELQKEIKTYIRPCRETAWFAEFHVEKDAVMTDQQMQTRINDFRRILSELEEREKLAELVQP